MDNLIPVIVTAIVLSIMFKIYKNLRVVRREKLINTFIFPSTITKKLIEKYPHLNDQQVAQVIKGLREYFHLCNIAGNKMVSMPSQAVDLAWHEFILFTRKYDHFCKKAIGRFLHHTPAEAMKSPTVAQEGIKRAWKIACYREKIKPKSAHKLPILFAIDSMLDIPDGFKYSLNCKTPGNSDFCAGHIGCGSGCGSGCGGDSSSDSSGCGGGCGGD